MNTIITKYDHAQRESNSRTRKVKRKLFSRFSAAVALSEEERELLRITQEARNEWIDADAKFQYANEEMLVDYCTYMLKACETRYSYYLKLVKERGLTRYI